MSTVLQARDADSPGYKTLLLDAPIGTSQAGEEIAGDGDFSIILHGQREFDVPDTVKKLTFPDGSTWSPAK